MSYLLTLIVATIFEWRHFCATLLLHSSARNGYSGTRVMNGTGRTRFQRYPKVRALWL